MKPDSDRSDETGEVDAYLGHFTQNSTAPLIPPWQGGRDSCGTEMIVPPLGDEGPQVGPDTRIRVRVLVVGGNLQEGPVLQLKGVPEAQLAGALGLLAVLRYIEKRGHQSRIGS